MKREWNKFLSMIVVIFMFINIIPVNLINASAASTEDYTIKLESGLDKNEKLVGVNVNITDEKNHSYSVKTDDNQEAIFDDVEIEGKCTLSIEGVIGFNNINKEVEFDTENKATIIMTELDKIKYIVNIMDENNNPINNAEVKVSGYTEVNVSTDSNGKAELTLYKGMDYYYDIFSDDKYEKHVTEKIDTSKDGSKEVKLIVKKYNIVTTHNEGGIVSSEEEDLSSLPYGTIKNIVITANEGYNIKSILVNNEKVEPTEITGFDKKVKSSIDIDTSKFDEKDITLNVVFQKNNTISFNYDDVTDDIVDEELGEVKINKEKGTFTIIPNDFYTITSCKQKEEVLDGEKLQENKFAKTYTIINEAEKDIEITFAKKISNVTYEKGSENGEYKDEVKLFANGENINSTRKAEYGSRVEVIFKPSEGNTLGELKINDEIITPDRVELRQDGTYKYVIEEVTESKYMINPIFESIKSLDNNLDEVFELKYNEANLLSSSGNKYIFINDDKVENKNNILIDSIDKDNIQISLSANEDNKYKFGQSVEVSGTTEIDRIYVKRKDYLATEYVDLKDNKISILVDKEKPYFKDGEGVYTTELFKDKATITNKELPIVNDNGGSNIKEIRYCKKDNTSNVTSIPVEDNKYEVTLTEKVQYYFWICDAAGNESDKKIVEANIDNDKPIIKVENIKDANDNDLIDTINNGILECKWTNSKIDIIFNVQDETSSTFECFYSVNEDLSDSKEVKENKLTIKEKSMNKIYYFWAKDEVGHTSDVLKVNIKIDTDKPVVEIVENPNKEWQAESKEIILNVKDKNTASSCSDFSKIEISESEDKSSAITTFNKGDSNITINEDGSYNIKLKSEDITQNKKYYCWIYDEAGNFITEEIEVKIDKDKPVVNKINAGTLVDGKFVPCINDYFGNYVNDSIYMFINIDDKEITSGIKDVIITYNTLIDEKTISLKEGVVVNRNVDGGYTATCILDEDYIKNVRVEVIDKVNNKSEIYTPNNVEESNIKVNDGSLINDSIAPTLNVTYPLIDNKYIADDELGTVWIKDSVNVHVLSEEKGNVSASGIGELNIQAIPFEDLGHYDYENSIEIFKEEFYLNKEDVRGTSINNTFNKNINEYPDGKYLVRVSVYDIARNNIFKDRVVCKDSKSPIIEKFVFDNKDNIAVEVKDDVDKFVYYSNKEVKVNVKINDGTLSSGINAIYYKLLPYGQYKDNNEAWIKLEEDQITINKDFKGCIAVKAIDNCKNESKVYYSDEIVISKDGQYKSQIVMKENGTDIYETNDTIYNCDKFFKYEIKNDYCGIRSMEYNLYADGILKDNDKFELTEENINIEEGKFFNYQTFDKIINYESANIKIEVIVEDNCGNIEKLTKTLAIDKSSPTVDSVTKDFYGDWTSKDITKINISVSDNKSISQTGVQSVYYSTKADESDAKIIEYDEKTKSYYFNTEKKEQGNSYKDTYYIWCYDKANNKSEVKEISINTDLDNPKVLQVTKSVEDNEDIGDVWTNKKVTVKAVVTDGGSGVKKVLYSKNKSDIGSNTGNIMEFDGTDYSFTVDNSENINQIYYIWAIDNVDNIGSKEENSEYSQVVVKIDITKPTINTIKENDDIVYDSKNGDSTDVKWYSDRVKFTIDAVDINKESSDVNSGIMKIEYSDNNGNTRVINEAEIKELANEDYYFYSIKNNDNKYGYNENYIIKIYDYAGNITTKEVKLQIDDINPSINSAEVKGIDSDKNLSYGIFANNYVEVDFALTDKNKDTDISSGLDKVVLLTINGSEKDEMEAVINNGKALICIPIRGFFEKNSNNILDTILSTVTVFDNAGNNSSIESLDKVSGTNIKSNHLIIEKDLPEVSIEIGNSNNNKDSKYKNNINIYNEKVNNENKIWVNGDVYFNVSISDEGSGINKIVAKINDTTVLNTSLTDKLNKSYVSGNTESTNTINTKGISANKDGSYLLEVEVTDNSGNVQNKYYTVYKDITAPSITEINFNKKNTADENVNNDLYINNADKYYYFNKESVNAEIIADDVYKTNGGISSCGIKSITYYLVDVNGKKIGNSITKNYDRNKNVAITDVINPNFKGTLCVVATDNLGNEKKEVVKSCGIVLENKPTSKISFSTPKTTKKDSNGINLYNNNVNVDITAKDAYSGIKQIDWSVSDINGVSDKGVITTDLNGNVDGGTKVSTDKNLITEISKRINIGNNSNNIIITVTITNNANNKVTNRTAISIDKTRPSIEVSYDNNNFNADYGNETLYYKDNRTATITITERNFDESLVNTLVRNTDGSAPSVSSFTQVVNDNANPDNNKYVAHVVYSNDGDYSFDISCEDKAGNSNNDYIEDRFTIDKTNPTLTVNYDNNNATNTNYYNADRTATITIVEHNFDPNKVVVNGTMLDNNQVSVQYANLSGWTTSGDTHTASINYSTDGYYSLDVDYLDKAGNASADIAQENFYIDKTNPELEISGVENMSSNKEEVKPFISYSDNNFDVNNVSIVLKGVLNSNINIPGQYTDIPNGQTFLFNDIPHEEFYDDIYLLDVAVTDKAGNKTTKSVSFNVNRFGSEYLLNPAVQEMNGQYIKNAKDIVLEEQNVDDIDVNSIGVKVIKDNVPSDLVSGNDFEIQKSGGNGSLFNYKYKIFKEAFKEDGAYYVIVSSVDKAGNTNVNNSKSKRAEINFFIDNTNPIIIPIDLSSNTTYAVDSKDITINVTDNMKLRNVNIYLDGKEVKYKNDGDSYNFKLKSKNSSQSIKLVATDMAGNEIVKEINNIYVTTNYFVRWYTNKTLFIGTIIGFIVVVGGVIALTATKSKKRRQNQ